MEQRERSEAQEQPTSENEIAAAIAAILAGLVVGESVVGAIAGLLALVPGLPDLGSDDDESGEDGSVSRRVAGLVVRDRPALRGDSRTLRATHIDNLLHRAHYAINAVERVATSEDIRKGFEKERGFYGQHREAERRRSAAARMVDAATELHGPILGWKHGHPKEPRPTHAAADGMNFNAGSVPAYTGALPGVLPGCTCTVTAPFENGRMLR